MIKSGKRYKITSVETGFVVDLSGVDNKSIIGWHDHGRDNQKWLVERWDLQSQWTIRSVRSGKYLGFEGAPSNGTPIVVIDNPHPWALCYADAVDRTKTRFLGTPFVVDWPGGNTTPGTQLLSWAYHNGNNQLWRFEEVIALDSGYFSKRWTQRIAMTLANENGQATYPTAFKRPPRAISVAAIYAFNKALSGTLSDNFGPADALRFHGYAQARVNKV